MRDNALIIPKPEAEFYPFIEPISKVFDRIGGRKNVLIDIGSGPGIWSLIGSRIFDHVIGLEVNDECIEYANKVVADNKVDNVEFINSANQDISQLPDADAMIAIMVLPHARSSEVIDIFKLASEKLAKGGVFFCMSQNPVGFLRVLFYLERFRWEGLIKGTRRMAALSFSLLEAIFSPRIRRINRARFYQRAPAIIELAEQSGLKLRADPKKLAQDDLFVTLSHICAPSRYSKWTVDWYLFEKP